MEVGTQTEIYTDGDRILIHYLPLIIELLLNYCASLSG